MKLQVDDLSIDSDQLCCKKKSKTYEKFITAYNGETAWTLNPFMGGSEPTKMDEEGTKSSPFYQRENCSFNNSYANSFVGVEHAFNTLVLSMVISNSLLSHLL